MIREFERGVAEFFHGPKTPGSQSVFIRTIPAVRRLPGSDFPLDNRRVFLYFETAAMILEKYYISKEHWQNALTDWMRRHEVLAPLKRPGGLFFERIDPSRIHEIVLDTARTVQPLKSLFLPVLEDVTSDPPAVSRPVLILGARACDLKALPVLDRPFVADTPDPHYASRRLPAVTIGSDCTLPFPSCFCTSVGNQPYAIEGFDLNVSKIWDGFVIEVGTLRGKVLLEGFDRSLKPLVKEEEEAQQRLRRETVQRVQKWNFALATRTSFEDLIQNGWDSPIWKMHSSACVECGACNFACPTCHSYFLDSVTPKSFQKLRGWDSCLLAGYDRASGLRSSRTRLFERFRHRLYCKFLYQKKEAGLSGCTGCGRCIDACPGRIDMRTLVQNASPGGSVRAA
jgi:sulfhydrogenase subunit beta (sulfur reductase)